MLGHTISHHRLLVRLGLASVLLLFVVPVAALAATPHDEVRARIARSHALETQSDYPGALAEAEQARRITSAWEDAGHPRPPADRTLAAEALFQIGFVQRRMARYPDALANAERARELLRPLGDSEALAKTLSLIGAVHFDQFELDEALQAYLASLEMSERIGDEVAAGRAHNNIGLALLELGRKQEAIEAFQRALAIHERLGPPGFLVNTVNNMGLALLEMDRPREALPYLQRALAMDQKSGDRYGQAKVYSNIGYAHEKLAEPRIAMGFHERALALRKAIGDQDGMARSLGAMAEVRTQLGDHRGAIPLFERAFAIADSIHSREDAVRTLGLLADARAAAGDTAGAFRDLRRFHEQSAALNDSTLRQRIAELDVRYQSLARARDLAAVSALAESRRTEVRVLVVGASLLAALLVLLGAMHVWRLRALRASRESEARYRALFQTSAVPTFLIEVGTRQVLDRNGPARALGDAADATAAAVDDLEPGWLRRALVRSIESADATHVLPDMPWTDDVRRERWTEVRGSPVLLGGRACLLVSVRDITEERRREESRQREDKLQSLGVLAGGIAHDFNNALTAILGYIALARQADDAEREEVLGFAEKAAVGASRLTAQLLTFARGGEPVRRSEDVGRLLRDAVAMAGAGSRMRIDLEIPDDLWNASVDCGQFSQVVSNIVINAQQATGEAGRLVVRAHNVHGGPPAGATSPGPGDGTAPPDDPRFVRIDFADNGTGIPEAIRSRVFEPYFTTRSGGNGLGLATAFAICRNHGGALTFESSEGGGTTFSAFFPASHDPASTVTPVDVETPDGIGSILVLDDEPLVRTSITRLLAHWGYEVESVADGRAAVDHYVERLREGRAFDLLIMDLTIPGGMGGREALTEILAHDPSARAVVASGYSDDPTMARHREAGFLAALAKPFQRDDLARTVIAALRSPRAPAAERRPPGV